MSAFELSSCMNRIDETPAVFPSRFTSVTADCDRNRMHVPVLAPAENCEHTRGQPVAIVIVGEPADTVLKWAAAILTLTKVQMSEATNEQFVTT